MSEKYGLFNYYQRKFYKKECENPEKDNDIAAKSPLKSLNPFLDSNILRANGGLARFCHLYLLHLHSCLIHADCNQICGIVQTEIYISRLKPRVKSIIRKCKTCIIFKKRP